MQLTNRFGKARVKRGLIHFLVGKIVSAVAGLLAVVLVVRGLSVPEFAGYSVLVALVEVFTAVSGLGLAHVVLRYVPELYATHRAHSLRSLILTTISIRSGVLIAALLLVFVFAQPLALLLNVDKFLPAFSLFLLVVAFRSSGHFLSQILESTLHQGLSQFAFSASAVGRCLGMLFILQDGSVSLLQVVALECLCDGFSCFLLGLGVFRVLRPVTADVESEYEDTAWWCNQRSAVAKFAATAYLQHLATLPFGGNTNRLVGGALFGDRVMATFGFAQSLYEYFKRYLPTQLLVGLIRPIVVARFSVGRNFGAVAALCDQALHVNLVFLFGAVAILSVAGEGLLSLVSAGKYGANSTWLLIAMLVLLGLETQRLILEVLTQTVRHYALMIPSNLFLSSSVLLGIAVYPAIGALSFPIANAGALLCANFWLVSRLKRLGYVYRHDWRGTVSLLIIFATSVGIGLLATWMGAAWTISGLVTALVYSLLFLTLLLRQSLAFVRELLGKPG